MAILNVPDLAYQEGTWTPVLTFGTPGNLSVAYSLQNGTYTRIGRLVYAGFLIATSSFTHTTASGNLNVTGLPFTSANVGNSYSNSACVWQGITKANYTQCSTRLVTNSNVIDFMMSGSGQSVSLAAVADVPTGGTVVLSGSLVITV